MKKTILTALAALLVAVPAVQAQKVNKEALLGKIEKSNAEIADAKKNAKAATWINRGKAFYDAAVEPTKSLFVGMDPAMLKLAIGDAKSTGTEQVNDVEFATLVYPYFTAYVKDGKIVMWKQTQWVSEEAVAKSLEAYNKAYELDEKQAPKIKEGLKAVGDYCSQLGNVSMDAGNFVLAADAYAQAYEAQSSPAYGQAEPALLYYAGYLRTVDGANNPESFVLGEKYLKKAIELGYNDENGFIYYYLFHCYYGQRDKNPELLQSAKQALLDGIAKYPKNDRILDGLVQLYTAPEDKVGDPAELTSIIEEAVKATPDNADLWLGRGRIYYALGNIDEALASFLKMAEIKPDLYESNYYVGLFYTIKGDDQNKVMQEKQYSSQAAYDADLKEVNAIYMQAIPYFEKAHEISPNDANTLEYLKSLCFRLRDEEGCMDKYNEYNALWKKTQGE